MRTSKSKKEKFPPGRSFKPVKIYDDEPKKSAVPKKNGAALTDDEKRAKLKDYYDLMSKEEGLGMTKEKAATTVGVARSTLADWERQFTSGKTKTSHKGSGKLVMRPDPLHLIEATPPPAQTSFITALEARRIVLRTAIANLEEEMEAVDNLIDIHRRG